MKNDAEQRGSGGQEVNSPKRIKAGRGVVRTLVPGLGAAWWDWRRFARQVFVIMGG